MTTVFKDPADNPHFELEEELRHEIFEALHNLEGPLNELNVCEAVNMAVWKLARKHTTVGVDCEGSNLTAVISMPAWAAKIMGLLK